MRRPPTRDDIEPGKPFMPDGQLQVRRLGHDRRVRPPFANQRLGAKTLVLFIDDGGDDQPAAGPCLSQDARGGDHRGHATLHVLRTAAEEPAVFDPGNERVDHPFHANRIEMPAEHHGRARSGGLEEPDDIGTTGSGLLQPNIESGGEQRGAAHLGDLRFARRARHERGVDGVDRDEIAQERDGIHMSVPATRG